MSTAAMSQSPALGLLPSPRLPARPALRVLEGGRAPARVARRSAFRRRRLVALALLVLVAVAAVLLVGALSTGLAGGGHPSSAAGASSPTVLHVAAPIAATSLIVQPGDTLWSIAAKVAPEADVRATVARLVELNGHDPLTVGQHLLLP
jgi:nucleoid-associated protein YgaU